MPTAAAAAPSRRRRPLPMTPLLTMRMARTLTQRDLSVLMQVRQQTVAKWETGRAVPPPDQRARLAAILGTSSEVLWPTGTLRPPL